MGVNTSLGKANPNALLSLHGAAKMLYDAFSMPRIVTDSVVQFYGGKMAAEKYSAGLNAVQTMLVSDCIKTLLIYLEAPDIDDHYKVITHLEAVLSIVPHPHYDKNTPTPVGVNSVDKEGK